MKQIQDIITRFEFEKVYITMKALDWQWNWLQDNKYVSAIPSISYLKDHAEELLKKALKEKSTHYSGGFRASYNGSINSLSLEFSITSYEIHIKTT
jgi:hypothetical protein